MNIPKVLLFTTPALMFTGAVAAGTLSAELETAIANLDPGDPIDVIVRCDGALDPASVPPDQLLTALRNQTAACETSLGEVLDRTALEPPETLWIINGIAARVPVASLPGLAQRAGVAEVYLNQTVELPPEPVLASIPGNPANPYWNIDETRATDLWALGVYGTGAVVATLDTGVDAAHADLGPKWRGGRNSWYDPNGEHDSPFDADGHGTGVMGLILAGNQTWFDLGMAPDAQWIAAKIFDDQGVSDLAKIHLALQWVLDPDGNVHTNDAPDVVNNSWVLQGSMDQCLGEFSTDIAALRALDIAVVFSAGNYGPDPYTSVSPANDPGSLAVGSIDSYQGLSNFSSRGPSACGGTYPQLTAPGEDVLTTGLTSNGNNPVAIAFASGTSFAAPHVSGALALLRSAFPGISMAEIETALKDGALDLGDLGYDDNFGAGLIDLAQSYFLLGGGTQPLDTDQDGVSDALDLCPATPLGEPVDSNGCSASQLDSDGDGVSDALDLCPATPAGEAVDNNGCSASQLDSDGDGVSDALDQCPNTPPGDTVDATGCSVTISFDLDGDGFATDGSTALDCNDGNAGIYPGALEIVGDGIDQDCNGYDLTISILTASYNQKRDSLSVEASSDLGGAADLSVVGYGAMSWNQRKAKWSLSVRNAGGNPGNVTVTGIEGSVTAPVQ